jgi:LuxR family maltose regulon positive regulatory protein
MMAGASATTCPRKRWSTPSLPETSIPLPGWWNNSGQTARLDRPRAVGTDRGRAVQARIELAHAHLTLGDLAGARTLMREIDELLTRRPGLSALAGQAQELQAQLAKQRSSVVPGASSLTAAELRLLPLLPTYLPFGEIAAELFLSPHTIKTQAHAIYRKLGASTRSEAVRRAREDGLLDG